MSREDKTTRKHRLVFNTARAFFGKSLNEFLTPGPNNMCDLTQVLLKFRSHQYTYTCDIKQMYMNVQVKPEDQPYLRFFHRDLHTQKIVVYQSRGHLFGLNCSPFIAIETLKFMARKEKIHSSVKEAILSGSIVDDILVSLTNEESISQYTRVF